MAAGGGAGPEKPVSLARGRKGLVRWSGGGWVEGGWALQEYSEVWELN